MPERSATGGEELTGNHYLCFPQIQKADAGILSVSALNAGMGGIIAWTGDPLMRIKVGQGGQSPTPLRNLKWQRLERWIPRADADLGGGVSLELTICAPGGYEPLARGGFVLCEFHNHSDEQAELDVVLDVRMRGVAMHVASPRPLHTAHTASAGVMERGIALEIGVPAPVAALGIAAEDPDASYQLIVDEARRVPLDGDTTVQHGELLNAEVGMKVRVRPGRSIRRAFYVGVGRDRDSALGHASHLARIGSAALLREARLELAHLARRTGDVKLSEIINRNLLFNHFFALARAFDDDRLYGVSSRSPLHVPGAALNERELLFWTLPCITLTDPLLARELLRDAFELYSAQPGMQWRYLDGGVIQPGFNLEQTLLYPLAVDRYVRESGDDTILDDPLIQDVLREIDGALESRLDEDVLLCNTEVLPGGERADHPYPTLGNVMLWAYAKALPRIWRGDDGDAPAALDDGAEEISDAIWQRCMADLDGAQIFVSTTDLQKQSAVYDDPLMSLSLISWFGFCPDNDPTLRETLTLLRSKAYPFWRDGLAPGLASRVHSDAASLAALCGDLLGSQKDAALRTVKALEMTDGLACDRYDPATGATAEGPHAAALAGLLAWTLIHAHDGATSHKQDKSASNTQRKKK